VGLIPSTSQIRPTASPSTPSVGLIPSPRQAAGLPSTSTTPAANPLAPIGLLLCALGLFVIAMALRPINLINLIDAVRARR